ncbi:uncharacterized protein V1518DRAFT_288856 [Limtongia smithiae]|uniref:uncharacterized protein n=1 Tax=Limtongia smithiae TaxID=1125753 RepID=UPI0034CD1B55
MPHFPLECTRTIRTLDLTNLDDTFADVERRYSNKLVVGRPTSLKSYLLDAAVPFTACCPNAEELKVGADIVDSQTSMITCLQYLHKLTTLDIQGATIGLGSFSGAAAKVNCQNLREIRIRCSQSLPYENAHIANFLKSLRPDSLTHIMITGISQSAALKNLVEGISAHCNSIESLRLHGTSKRIFSDFAAVGFTPFLEELEIITTSSAPMSKTSRDLFANWLMYCPTISTLSLKGHDVMYLCHEFLTRPFNELKTLKLETTRSEEIPLFHYDLFFRALASCDDLEDFSITDSLVRWTEGAKIRLSGALKHLRGLKRLELNIHGLAGCEVSAILEALPMLRDFTFSSGLTDDILKSLYHNDHTRSLTSQIYPSTISADVLTKLFETRDDDDQLPIVVTMEAGSTIMDSEEHGFSRSYESYNGVPKWTTSVRHSTTSASDQPAQIS